MESFKLFGQKFVKVKNWQNKIKELVPPKYTNDYHILYEAENFAFVKNVFGNCNIFCRFKYITFYHNQCQNDRLTMAIIGNDMSEPTDNSIHFHAGGHQIVSIQNYKVKSVFDSSNEEFNEIFNKLKENFYTPEQIDLFGRTFKPIEYDWKLHLDNKEEKLFVYGDKFVFDWIEEKQKQKDHNIFTYDKCIKEIEKIHFRKDNTRDIYLNGYTYNFITEDDIKFYGKSKEELIDKIKSRVDKILLMS